MELVLGQQSSPSSDLAPETPIADPQSVTAEPPDQNPHISTSTPDPPILSLTPDPTAAEPEAEALPTDTTPTEPDAQEEDQVNLKKKFFLLTKFQRSGLV